MSGKITITNRTKQITEIDIEGIIGVPESGQFGKTGKQVATYQRLQEVIRSLREIETQKIIVNIRSTGGNVNDALLIYDTLVSLGCEITTRCYGYVASAATIIAQAAGKGNREISKNALYLIHKSALTAEGNAEELARTIDLLAKTDERIASVYAQASGKDVASFTDLMNEHEGNGRWLTAEETIAAGLADKTIAADRISNDAREWVNRLNLPEIPAEYMDNDRPENLNIKKRWQALLNLLGITPEKEWRQTESENETAECTEAVTELEQSIRQYETPKDNTDKIADLQNRIVELEAANAKLRAKATQTFPKEDPSNRDIKRESNAEAYENDMKNFKTL